MLEPQTVLKEITDIVLGFSKVITHVHAKRLEDGRLLFAAPATDRSVEIRATTNDTVDGVEGVMCLGSLPFLSQVFSSSFAKSMTMAMNFDTTSDGKMIGLRTIKFESGKKFSTLYRAVDPSVGTVVMPKVIKIQSWPISFLLDSNMLAEFKEARLIAQASNGSIKDDLFELAYSNDEIIASFGGASNSVLQLTKDFEIEDGFTDTTLNVKLLGESFMAAMSMASIDKKKRDIGVSMSSKGVMLFFDGLNLSYEVVLFGRRKDN